MSASALKLTSLKEIKMGELLSDGITYHVDDKYITIRKDGNEFYYIDKDRLLTEQKRLEWVAHMSVKNWCNSYKFYKTMVKAIDIMSLS